VPGGGCRGRAEQGESDAERRRDEYGAECALRARDERRLDGGSAYRRCFVRHALNRLGGRRAVSCPNVPICCLTEPKAAARAVRRAPLRSRSGPDVAP